MVTATADNWQESGARPSFPWDGGLLAQRGYASHKCGNTFARADRLRYNVGMAASVSKAAILTTLHPADFKKRLSCDRTLLPADGVDVPIVLDLAGCHAKPRVLASCTSGQELLFSEPVVLMIHQLAKSSGSSELRVRFSDREVAPLGGGVSGAGSQVHSSQALADEIVATLVRFFGKQVMAAALARVR